MDLFDVILAKKMTGGSGGGGGSGDFSTAEVTLINSEQSQYAYEVLYAENCPSVVDEQGEAYITSSPYNEGSTNVGETIAIFTVPLYKGCCYWSGMQIVPENWTVSAVTGGITYLEEYNEFVITGTGTITLLRT